MSEVGGKEVTKIKKDRESAQLQGCGCKVSKRAHKRRDNWGILI